MRGERPGKPPPLFLASEKHKVDPCFKQKSLEEKASHKFSVRYDAFQGILKRVSEMKLSGSLESEEPSTGSEKSESSRSERLKRHFRFGSSPIDNHSNVSTFEDESCASSVTSSEPSVCSPYDEIPRVSNSNRYSYGIFSSYSAYTQTNISSLRESLPSPISPTEFYKNISNQNSLKEYKSTEKTENQNPLGSTRPKSFNGIGGGGESPTSSSVDLNGSCTKFYGRELFSRQSGQPVGISEVEKHQLEMFFKSLKTDVFVCGSLANLYLGWKEQEGNWTYRHTGVVIVVFDSGNTRCRRKRRIQILLAERGTCFPLWKDTIDNLSAYRKSGTAFHTMHLSCDHRQMVGLSFDFPSEADKLLIHLEELTSDPENINISAPGARKKKKTYPKEKVTSLPHKRQISNPCLFQHVTSVAAKDKPVYMSLQTLIDNESIKKAGNIC